MCAISDKALCEGKDPNISLRKVSKSASFPPKVALTFVSCNEYCTSVIKLWETAALLAIKQKGTLFFVCFSLINVYFHIKTFNSEQCNIVQVIESGIFSEFPLRKNKQKPNKSAAKKIWNETFRRWWWRVGTDCHILWVMMLCLRYGKPRGTSLQLQKSKSWAGVGGGLA